MAKISPVSIKYMIHASFSAEGALEKPDIIGAIFGQTEGLLGADLEMRELQKEGKIGRIEVDVERSDKRTVGKIQIPTALDQSETTLIAAAVETIDRIGPCDAQIEVERIEDVRGSKRDYILERAKKLMQGIQGSTDSREIANQIKDSAKMAGINEYGESKLPCGDLSDREIIVVEGRADVLNLLRNGIKNVIGMNGTKLPPEIRQLGEEKDLVLFIDGDRGGKLIAQNVVDNAKVKVICVAPEGKEVEELTGKEILMCLRKRVSPGDFFSFNSRNFNRESVREERPVKEIKIGESEKLRFQDILRKNKGSAVFLDENLNDFRKVSARGVSLALTKIREKPYAIIVDGAVTSSIIRSAEEANVRVIAAKNFASTSNSIQMISL